MTTSAAVRTVVRGFGFGRRPDVRAAGATDELFAEPPRLILRFAAYTALALLIAAAAIFWFLRGHATESAQQAVGFRARSVAYTLLREQLRPSDFERPVTGTRRVTLDALFARQVLVEGARTVRVALWSPNGELTYSNAHSLIGRVRSDPNVRGAVAGETVLQTRRLEGGAGTGTNPKVLTAYVPVRLTGGVEASGVFEVSEDYAPVSREVQAAVTPVTIVLGLVLLGLYASLFPILRRVTKVLANRNRCLAEQARALECSLRERERAQAELQEKTALLELLEAVAVAANESSTVDEATQICLDLVCAHTGWPVGHAYTCTGRSPVELVPASTWHLDDPARVEPFRALTHATPLGAADGLPGRVLASGRPVWVTDVTEDPGFVRAEQAKRSGLRAAFAFPVLVGAEVAAVLEFFSTEAKGPDDQLLEVMAYVGTQLGRVTERTRAADEALRESEARFRAIFERAAVGIVITDVDGRVTAGNSAFHDMLGYGDEELSRLAETDLVHPDDVAATVERARELAAGERDHYQSERRYLRRDGETVWGRVAGSVVRGADGRPQFEIAMVENITDQKQLEEQLRQSQKMEAVGLLAGGVAHDFNNLLTVISGYTEVLLGRAGEDDPARPRLDAIRTAADQAAGLTRQLLAFSRKQVLQPRVLDLNAIVAETESMLQRLIGEDVELTTALDPALGLVRADPGQIGQVILNLAVNARDAMAGGGRLTIETANLDRDEAQARHRLSLEPGRYVAISVSDTGHGMDERTQARIFEPFFTTKEQGRGTGLGLATVYGILAQSGGGIAVRSAPGAGTTFTVCLPRIEEGVAAHEQPPPRLRPARGSETILLVEDEAAVRDLIRDVLGANGYSVLEAAHVDDALALGEAHRGPIDLMLTDVVMPGMSGPALAARLLGDRPALKVVFMSGYTDDAVARNGVLEPAATFLQKPFAMDVLLRTVREVLDAEAPSSPSLKEVA
jgi:PAS domain S-box-containing protein